MLLGHRDAAYLATGAGARAAGLGLPPVRHQGRSVVALRHAMAVADVAEYLLSRHYQHGTPTWISERELRQGQLVTGAPPVSASPRELTVARTVGGGWPDGLLVLTAPDGVVWRMAVEVELTQKAARFYAAKIAYYRRLLAAGTVARVRWYAATAATGRAIARAIRDGGGAGLMTVEPFLPA